MAAMGKPEQTDPPSPKPADPQPGAPAEIEDFFDSSFLAELEELAATDSEQHAARARSSPSHQKLSEFLSPPGQAALTEDGFIQLPSSRLTERTNALLDTCRQGTRGEAALAVESFVVFFQALEPTLSEDASRQIRRVFFRLVPTLIHIAYNGFSDDADQQREGLKALRNLERILIEISSVRLTPNEAELVFRSIDHLSDFIAVAEYTMANDIISSQLISIIERNRLTRALFRLMEVEVAIQRYLKDKMGYSTPQFTLPRDVEVLSAYGPIRILDEQGPDGSSRRFLQVHLPDIPILRDVVLHLEPADGGEARELRLDALGSVELAVPDGTYTLGLVYNPE
jgi:hypothetical protein